MFTDLIKDEKQPVGLSRQGNSGFSDLIYSPEPEEEEAGAVTQFGRGVAAGTLGVGEAAGTVGRWLGERIGSETLTEAGRGVEGYFEEAAEPYQAPQSIQGNIWDNPALLGKASWWAYNIGNMVPSLAASLIPAGAAGIGVKIGGNLLKWTQPTVTRLAHVGQMLGGGAAGGALEGSQTYKEVLRNGGTEEEAARAGELMALGSGVLNAIGTGKILQKAGSGFKANIIRRLGAGAWEGITEGLEEPTEVFARYLGKYLAGEEVPEGLLPDLLQSLKEAITIAPIAAVTGFGAGGSMTEQTPDAPVKPTINLPKIAEDLKGGALTFDKAVELRDRFEPFSDEWDGINKAIIEHGPKAKVSEAVQEGVQAAPGAERSAAVAKLTEALTGKPYRTQHIRSGGRMVEETPATRELPVVEPSREVEPTVTPTMAPPTEPPAVGGEKAKEPWEMTYEEFAAPTKKAAYHNLGAGQSIDEFGGVRALHKMNIEAALKEGLPVPESVLADYPDLITKEAPSVQEEKVQEEVEGEARARGAKEGEGQAGAVVPYSKDLDIRNIEALPRGTGARYLLAIKGPKGEFIAKGWKRVAPKLKAGETLIDMEAPKSLATLTIKAKGIRGKTEEEFEYDINAQKAVDSVESRREVFNRILGCLNE